MDIVNKKRSGREEKVHIFKFSDDKDLKDLSSILKEVAEDVFPDKLEWEKELVLSLVDKIVNRADGKYGDAEYPITSCLFEDEIDSFANELVYMIYGLYFRIQYQEEIIADRNERVARLLQKYGESLDKQGEFLDILEGVSSLKEDDSSV